jgi:hypothetical protein
MSDIGPPKPRPKSTPRTQRSRANADAGNLLDSIDSLEEAIRDITDTAKALSSVGIRVPSAAAAPLQYATAFRNLADKILTETLQHG